MAADMPGFSRIHWLQLPDTGIEPKSEYLTSLSFYCRTVDIGALFGAKSEVRMQQHDVCNAGKYFRF